MTNKLLKFTLQLMMVFMGYHAFSQAKTADTAVLDHEPYFARHTVKPSDSLFLKDIEILKQYGDFNSVDSELLKAPILSNIIVEQVGNGKAATYRTLIAYIKDFKSTEAYKDFAVGMLLYRKLEGTKVNPANWETDKALFARMGFTQSDLEDFAAYIQEPSQQGMTYKQAYISYMKYIDSLEAVKGK